MQDAVRPWKPRSGPTCGGACLLRTAMAPEQQRPAGLRVEGTFPPQPAGRVTAWDSPALLFEPVIRRRRVLLVALAGSHLTRPISTHVCRTTSLPCTSTVRRPRRDHQPLAPSCRVPDFADRERRSAGPQGDPHLLGPTEHA